MAKAISRDDEIVDRQPLLRSANRAIGLGRACGHGRTAEAALPGIRAR